MEACMVDGTGELESVRDRTQVGRRADVLSQHALPPVYSTRGPGWYTSAIEPRRRGGRRTSPAVHRRLNVTVDNVVAPRYAVLHHYRACSTARNNVAPCHRLIADAYLDHAVLRYRPQLVANVRRVLHTLD